MVICELAGVAGSFFTFPSIKGWYANLAKPPLTPPNWVFGPAWTALYALMGAAAYFVYRDGKGEDRKKALTLFAAQLILNSIWSVLFFGLKSPEYGFACIVFLWLLIAATASRFYRISKSAGLLMLPYLAWVTFASYLNYGVLLLN